MTTEMKATMDHTASVPMHDHQSRTSAAKAGRFSLHLLEMMLAMMAGMPILSMLRNLIPPSSILAPAFKSGTIMYSLTMAVFMTVPMVAWMIVRGHGWRHSAEMAFAMLAPMAVIIVLRLLGADAYLPWLGNAGDVAMPLAMLIVMLYHRDHYTGEAGHSAHATHSSLH